MATKSKKDAMLDMVRECFEKNNYDPISELIEIVQSDDPDLSLSDKIAIHKELAQYVAPKLRSMDLQADVSGDVQVSVMRFAEATVKPLLEGAADEAFEEDSTILLPVEEKPAPEKKKVGRPKKTSSSPLLTSDKEHDASTI